MSDTFSDHGIFVSSTAHGDIKTKCPQCTPGRKNKGDASLSVNVEKGMWHCHNTGCGFSGRLKTNNPEYPPQQITPYAPKSLNTQPLTPPAIKWFADRGISEKTAAYFGCKSCLYWFSQLNKEGPAIAIPFMKNGEVVNWKIRSIDTKAFAQVKGGEQVLFNYDNCRGKSIVAITEGELDAMALHETGFQGGICSCPSGAAAKDAKNLENKLAFMDDAADVFEQAKTVILATDNDEPGWAWHEVLANKIGVEKCRSLKWSSGCKDANDVLMSYGPEVLAECLMLAQPLPCPGVTTIGEHWDDVQEHINRGGKRLGYSTGWHGLDQILRIDTKTLNIVTGIPGHGKSEVLDQLIVNTIKKHRWKWAIFSPENWPLAAHFQKLAEKYIGKPMFQRYSHEIPAMTIEEIQQAREWCDENIRFITLGDQCAKLDDVLAKFRACVKMYGVKGILIDPYNELDHVRDAGLTETEHISKVLSQIRNFSRLYDVSAWLVAHPTKLQKKQDGTYPYPTLYDIAGSAHFRNKADVGITIWRDIGKDNTGNTKILVQKVRNKEHGMIGEIELKWQRSTGLFTEARTSVVPDADVPGY